MDSTYTPKPVDTSDVELTDDLLQLTEQMAENVHELWAKQRISEGWKFGNTRDDAKKEHPCLVPYFQLSDSEKEYDRISAIETIKLILKLGYKITK
jgi:ryanodine receptor 2